MSPQTITDTSANVGQYATFTVDIHHNVNIAYYDVNQTSLKVATITVVIKRRFTMKNLSAFILTCMKILKTIIEIIELIWRT
jgi:hypothetical protein